MNEAGRVIGFLFKECHKINANHEIKINTFRIYLCEFYSYIVVNFSSES